MQIPGEVLEGSGSGGFRCRYLLRFQKVRVQMLSEIPKGSYVFNGIHFLGVQKHLNAVYDVLIYL